MGNYRSVRLVATWIMVIGVLCLCAAALAALGIFFAGIEISILAIVGCCLSGMLLLAVSKIIDVLIDIAISVNKIAEKP